MLEGVETTRWLEPEEQRTWRLFLDSHAQLMAALGRELHTDAGLSPQDYAVLVDLSERPDGVTRAFELASALAWEKTRLSHHIARMVERGLVSRRRCPSDRRGSFVAITRKGRRALEAAAPGHVASVREHFIDLLTPEELEVLTAISEKVLARLQESGHDGAGCRELGSAGC